MGFELPNGAIAVSGLLDKSKVVRVLRPESTMLGVNSGSLLPINVLQKADRCEEHATTKFKVCNDVPYFAVWGSCETLSHVKFLIAATYRAVRAGNAPGSIEDSRLLVKSLLGRDAR
jgi:hypothetical protein